MQTGVGALMVEDPVTVLPFFLVTNSFPDTLRSNGWLQLPTPTDVLVFLGFNYLFELGLPLPTTPK
jgi:hypothetical protein